MLVIYTKAYDNADKRSSIPREPDDDMDGLDLFDLARFFASSSTKFKIKKIYIYIYIFSKF